MSTTDRGDAFARTVFEHFRESIDGGRFLGPPERCKIFWKKQYYSKDRASNIVVDISIEMYLPGADKFSVLYVIECKRLGRQLGVDDVEELYAKLDQLGDANGKGVVASASALQKSALTYCASKGIGVLRYYDEGEFKWELYRKEHHTPGADPAEVATGLMSMSHQSRGHRFYCASPLRFTHEVQVLFQDLAPEGLRDAFKPARISATPPAVRHVSDRYIEDAVQNLLAAVDYKGGRVPLASICEREHEGGRLLLHDAVPRPSEDDALGVLGRVRFGTPTEITIFHVPEQKTERASFTLAHELGHHFLGHGRYMSSEYCDAEDIDVRALESVPGLADIRQMERQANRFASRLLLPTEQLRASFEQVMALLDLKDRGHGPLFVDDRRCNLDNFYNATSQLTQLYRTSRQVITFRLVGMGLLVDRRKRP